MTDLEILYLLERLKIAKTVVLLANKHHSKPEEMLQANLACIFAIYLMQKLLCELNARESGIYKEGFYPK